MKETLLTATPSVRWVNSYDRHVERAAITRVAASRIPEAIGLTEFLQTMGRDGTKRMMDAIVRSKQRITSSTQDSERGIDERKG